MNLTKLRSGKQIEVAQKRCQRLFFLIWVRLIWNLIC